MQEYHDLLERYEGESCQTYLWDGNVAGMSERSPETGTASGGKLCRKYYLQDELGSPLRLSGADGSLGEAYGYDEFGRDLYGNQGEAQPFGYTGYQYDSVAGTYFAQAREYEPQIGRFQSVDLMKGFPVYPLSLNEYIYCWDNPGIRTERRSGGSNYWFRCWGGWNLVISRGIFSCDKFCCSGYSRGIL